MANSHMCGNSSGLPQPADTPAPSSCNITFGIELELMVITMEQARKEEPVLDKTDVLAKEFGKLHWPFRAIYKAITAARPSDPISCHMPRGACYIPCDYSKWSLTNDFSVRLTPSEVKLMASKVYDWDCVELVSRVFNAGKVDEWQDEIATVLDAVLALNSEHVQILVNPKCGFHVHVGRGSQGIPLETQKKTMLLVAALERRLDTLHAASRFYDAPWEPQPDAPKPLLFHADLYNAGPGTLWRVLGQTPATGYERIRESETTDQLRHAMTLGHHRALRKHQAYSLDNFIDTACERRGGFARYDTSVPRQASPLVAADRESVLTIEFRQHRGTLHFAEIRAWIMLTTQLVRVAHGCDGAAVDALVAEYRELPFFPLQVPMVLAELDVDWRAVAFYRARLHEPDWLRSPEQPQHASKPFGELMAFVNINYQWDNSPAFVNACVYDRASRGVYGDMDRDDTYGEFRGWFDAYVKMNCPRYTDMEAMRLIKFMADEDRIRRRASKALRLRQN